MSGNEVIHVVSQDHFNTSVKSTAYTVLVSPLSPSSPLVGELASIDMRDHVKQASQVESRSRSHWMPHDDVIGQKDLNWFELERTNRPTCLPDPFISLAETILVVLVAVRMRFLRLGRDW